MSEPTPLILGEFRRLYDDRYRIALPAEILTQVGGSDRLVLAKEQEGCLSLWDTTRWKTRIEDRLELLKMRLERSTLDRDEFVKVQRLARLLSTRSREIELGHRGRLLIPEGFREFLGVDPKQEVIVVGAGTCVEIWNPAIWIDYLRADIGRFNELFSELAP